MFKSHYENGARAALAFFKCATAPLVITRPHMPGGHVIWNDEQGPHQAPWSGQFLQPGHKGPWQSVLLSQQNNEQAAGAQEARKATRHIALDLAGHALGI